MKKFTFFVLIFFVIYASCKKEKIPKQEDVLVINDETMALESGIIETSHWYASGEDRITFFLSFFDKKISNDVYMDALESEGQLIKEFYGTSSISFTLDSAHNNFDYRLDGPSCVEEEWDFPGHIIIDYQPDGEMNKKDIESGRLCVTRKNDQFEVEFEGVTKNNEDVGLYYYGDLCEVETFE